MLHQANWQKKMAREGRLDDYYNDYYNMLYGTALADSFLTNIDLRTIPSPKQ
jgi:hypothetical protein